MGRSGNRDRCGALAEWAKGSAFGVMIGVKSALTSQVLMKDNPALCLVLIDPWRDLEGGIRCTQVWHDANYDRMLHHMNPTRLRACIMPMASQIAVCLFQDFVFDFMVLDADHRRMEVARDCFTWWSKIKNGGWLGGKAYRNNVNGRLWGIQTVKEGVDDFIEKSGFSLEVRGTCWRIVKRSLA